MKRIATAHQNSEDLAKGLLPFIQTALPAATCRPWNRFESQETKWLLSPVRAWPLLRPCKYYTEMKRAEEPTDSRLVAGIYVEKGFTGDAAKMCKFDERMDTRWGWHGVLQGLQSGAIHTVIEDLPGECSGHMELQVSGGYPGDTYGTYCADLSAADGARPLSVQALVPQSQLAIIGKAKSWLSLVEGLASLSAHDWLWIDLYLHVNLNIASRLGGAGGEAWADGAVWERILAPLLPWITAR